MLGTLLNAGGILAGGALGLALKRPLTPAAQSAMKTLLGVATVFVGLRLAWVSLGGGLGNVFKQLLIVLLAMTLGKLLGKLLHLQAGLNRVGQYATRRLPQTGEAAAKSFSEGFVVCTLLFCGSPMSVLGAAQEGVSGHWPTLALKAGMEAMGAMSFVSMFGGSVLLSALPVLVWQGTITLLSRLAAPLLNEPALLDAFNATGGMLVFCVALIILEIKKVELADYLPSLAIAPLLTSLWNS
jgi:hypothetical protein